MKMWEPLLKNYQEFPEGDSRTLNRVRSPSESGPRGTPGCRPVLLEGLSSRPLSLSLSLFPPPSFSLPLFSLSLSLPTPSNMGGLPPSLCSFPLQGQGFLHIPSQTRYAGPSLGSLQASSIAAPYHAAPLGLLLPSFLPSFTRPSLVLQRMIFFPLSERERE